jgi:hypothetical protein
LEDEEMFRLAKCKANLPLGSEADSHRHDQVNFSHSKVSNAMAPITQSSIINVGKGSDSDLVVTHNGAEVLECLYGDGI